MKTQQLTKAERRSVAFELGGIVLLWFLASFAPWPF